MKKFSLFCTAIKFLFSFFSFFLFVVALIFSYKQGVSQAVMGAEQLEKYVPSLKNKNVGLLVNHTAMVGKSHLVDTLLNLGVKIKTIFVPEHGFRGQADAGESIENSIDKRTQIPIVSLYGKQKKPTAQQLDSIDILLYDIQDVGVRFYTYISSMHYLMEACAESNKPLIILDRPNPYMNHVDGCILDQKFQSFVGMHPIPILYGLSYGELALMINAEGWLKDRLKCNLQVIEVVNFSREQIYILPTKPSPNLPNALAIALYPSLCLFEGTSISVGRGTYMPFQIIGSPNKKLGTFTFTPKSIVGMSKKPMHENEVCYGIDLSKTKIKYEFSLKYILDFYQKSGEKKLFFNSYFDTLVGNNTLKEQILSGKSEREIRKSWEKDLKNYLKKRKKYLLYPEKTLKNK